MMKIPYTLYPKQLILKISSKPNLGEVNLSLAKKRTPLDRTSFYPGPGAMGKMNRLQIPIQ
jgi:hypothetical protein